MLILTKRTWKEKFLSTVKEVLFFHYHSLYSEKMTIMPALCSMLRLLIVLYRKLC